ncbi:MAG: DHH family phosphoesterase [Planctomycetota bacterium]
MSEWTPTTTAEEVAARLRDAGRVAVLTHAKPDGDALGSTGALVRSLNVDGARATAFYVGAMPLFSDALLGDTSHQHLTGGAVPEGEFDAVVVCDTGSWGQLDALGDWVRGRADRTVVIDHHLQGDGEMSGSRLLETHAAAVCEPVADVCAAVLSRSMNGLPKEIATLLYLGIATDTGWFRFSSVTPRTLRTVADLVEAGADTVSVLSAVTQRDRPARLRAMARALASATFECGGELVVMRLTVEDIRAAKAGPEDLGGMQDAAMSIGSVRAVAIFVEVESPAGEGPLVKASLRSKPGEGMVDVSRVAGSLGGGGHANAAGVKQRVGMDEAVGNVLVAFERERAGASGSGLGAGS